MSYEQLVECENLLKQKEQLVAQATIAYNKTQLSYRTARGGQVYDDEINELNSALQKIQQATQERDQVLNQRQNLLQQLVNEKVQNEQEIQNLRNDLKRLLEVRIPSLNEQIEHLQNEGIVREKYIKHLSEVEIPAREAKIKQQLDVEIAKRDEIKHLKERYDKVISERDDAIKQLRGEIAKKEQEIKRLKMLVLHDEPQIKKMLFATFERRGADNVTQVTTVQPDETFDPEKDKYLISYWKLKGNPIDEKHLNTGKMHDADVVADRFNNPESSCHFDGSAFMKGDAKHFPKGNKAISLWFKADKNTDGKIEGGTLFSYCGEDESNNMAIVVNHDLDHASEKSGNLCAHDLGKPGKSIKYDANSKDHFDDWNHLVLSSDNGAGTDIYLNGQCVAHRNICFNAENLEKSIQTFGIGAFVYQGQPVSNSIDPMFEGSINDVMVYSRGLLAEEVSALYLAQLIKPGTDANLKKWMQENAPDIYKKYIQSSSTLFPAKLPQNNPQASESANAEIEAKSELQYSV